MNSKRVKAAIKKAGFVKTFDGHYGHTYYRKRNFTIVFVEHPYEKYFALSKSESLCDTEVTEKEITRLLNSTK